MEEGTLAKWLVKEGDSVSSGDMLAEIETDKATMEFEAVDEGTISKILVPEGSDGVKVGTVIALMGGEGEPKRLASAPESGDSASSRAAESEAPAPEAGRTRPALAQLVEASAQPRAERRAAPEQCPEGTGDASRPPSAKRLRDAMAEEMRADDRVFVMGEEVAQYQGAYKVTQGLLDEFGPRRVIDTPITEYGFAGHRVGRGDGRAEADHRVHDLQLRDAGDRPHHQFGGQDQLHVGRADALPDRVPRPQRRGEPGRRAAQPELRAVVRAACPGLVVIAPYDAADAKGLLKAAIRSDDPVVFLENELLYGQSFDVPEVDDYVLPIGKARIMREGKRRHAGQLFDRRRGRAGGRRDAGRARGSRPR